MSNLYLKPMSSILFRRNYDNHKIMKKYSIICLYIYSMQGNVEYVPYIHCTRTKNSPNIFRMFFFCIINILLLSNLRYIKKHFIWLRVPNPGAQRMYNCEIFLGQPQPRWGWPMDSPHSHAPPPPQKKLHTALHTMSHLYRIYNAQLL